MIYNGNLRDTTNRSSDKYIEINSCNVQRSGGRAHTVIRKDGRVDYHLLFVAEGECSCFYKGVDYLMKSGDFVIYPPCAEQRYSFPEGVAVTTMWLHFAGSGVKEIFEDLGLCGGVFSAVVPAEVKHYFKQMINANSLGLPKHRVLARGYLLNLLAAVANTEADSGISVYKGDVADMLEFINLNWQKNLSVFEVADRVKLSESRAAHLFKETVGKPMHRYINDLKIENSKWLLLNSDMSVNEISAMVGFEDSLYFSRIFKARIGVSPRAYRKGDM